MSIRRNAATEIVYNITSGLEKINILRTSLYFFHGVDASIPNYNYSYWTSQQAMNDTYSKAVGFVISGAQGGIKYLNKPSDRAYVLPIAYF